jgi:sugar lactone lactonase YvrE
LSNTVFSGEVRVYRSDGRLLYTMAEFRHPQAVAADTMGRIYIADRATDTITVVDRLGRTLWQINKGISGPTSMVVDPSGTLYVANGYNNSVTVYRPGAVAPSRTVQIISPVAIALDSQANVYVASYYANQVVRYAPGLGEQLEKISAGIHGPTALALNETGTLFVANNAGVHSITVYDQGSRTPSHEVRHELTNPMALALQASGNLYLVDNGGRASNGAVDVISTKSWKVVGRLSRGISHPTAIAFGPAGQVYVANSSTKQDVTVYGTGASLRRTIATGGGTPSALLAYPSIFPTP